MKLIKALSHFAIAVGVLAAFAATASATILTSPTGTVYTSWLTLESEGATSIHGSFTTITCQKGHIEAKVEKHGTNVTAGGKIATYTLSECNFPVKILKGGTLTFHPYGCNSNNECTATVTSTGLEMTVETSIANCLFTTNESDIGTLTPSNDTNGHATIDHNSAGIPRTGHSIFCGSSGTVTGSYTVTVPNVLYVNA